MENDEIINRIKLMMNYDSKKTLTENKILFEDNGQQPNADVMAIYNTLKSAVYDMGTDIAKLNQAFDLISKSTDNSNLISLDNYMAKKPIYGGFNSFYRFLQQLLNGELGLRNFKDAERYRDILNRIPGITASFEKGRRSEDMKSDSFIINFNQKPVSQKTTADYEKARKEYEAKQATNSKGISGKPKFNWTTAPTIGEAKNGKYIKHGMSGDSVVEIQTKLNEKGGYNLETKTKKFGTNTKNALIDFQKKNNITPSKGVFGPLTWRVLFAQPNANVETPNQQPQEKPILQNPMNQTKGFSDYKLNNPSQPTAQQTAK